MELQPITRTDNYIEPRSTFSIRDDYFGSEDTYHPEQTPIAFNTFLAGTSGAGASALNRDITGRIQKTLYDDQKDFCQIGFNTNDEGHTYHMSIKTDRYNDDNGTLRELMNNLERDFPDHIDFRESFVPRNYGNYLPPGIEVHPIDEVAIQRPAMNLPFLYSEYVSQNLGNQIIDWLAENYEHGPLIAPREHMGPLSNLLASADNSEELDPTEQYFNTFKWHTMNFLVPVRDSNFEGSRRMRTTREYATNQRNRLAPHPETGSVLDVAYYARSMQGR